MDKSQNGPFFIYTWGNVLHFVKDNIEFYLQGTPVFVNDPTGIDNWVKEIFETTKKSNNLKDDLITKMRQTSGLFALILNISGEIIIAVDVIRNYPVFYGFQGDELFITDNMERFQKENGRLHLDYDSIEEFCSCGLVLGNRTFYKDVKGVQSGEFVSISNTFAINSDYYFRFVPDSKPVRYGSIIDFSKAFDSVLMHVFSRLIRLNPKVNRWVVPLSGGHDSRLIVNYLYRLGVKNVICFTYGTEENEQAKISKQVADILGYEWHFVEYTATKWQALHCSGLFDEYIRYASNGVSIPHLQDFLAVYELKKQGKVKEGDAFLPGHTAITGSDFCERTQNLETREEALQYVYSLFEIMSNDGNQPSFLYDFLSDIYDDISIPSENFKAYCHWKEKKVKFVSNSIRVYEFFGFRSFQPLWDKEFVDFWLSIPSEERVDRRPMFLAERNGVLLEQLINIPYAKENQETLRLKISKIAKLLLPNNLIVKLLRVFKSKAKLNEGLNNIYCTKISTVEGLLEPMEDFPPYLLPYFNMYLQRYPFQMDPNTLTTLYTIRKAIDDVE